MNRISYVVKHLTNLLHKPPELASQHVQVDGNNITFRDLKSLHKGATLSISEASKQKIKRSSQYIDKVIESQEPTYGINTGFGSFSNVNISNENISQLQLNLLRSHATGVGPALDPDIVRRVLALRANALAKGHSGIRIETLQTLVDLFNSGCTPLVPEQGTVGASGDLAPLAHIGLGLVGEGQILDVNSGKYEDAKTVLQRHNITPAPLLAKEGLALINGTQFMLGIGSFALEKALISLQNTLLISGLSSAAFLGHPTVYDPRIAAVRPHPGQITVSNFMREIWPEGTTHVYEHDVQDPYSFRCIPQVLGPVVEATDDVLTTVEIELNSATDNPLVFFDSSPHLVSGGNFHGEYIASVFDRLSIESSRIANISYSRIMNLLDPNKSRGLPAYLVDGGGLNSGLMTWENVAAALLSEIKAMAYPGSVDSLPTCSQKEDHVSMGGYSVRKALTTVENVEKVLTVELLCALHACHHRFKDMPSFRLSPILQDVYDRVKDVSPIITVDRYTHDEYNELLEIVKSGSLFSEIFLTKSTLIEEAESRSWVSLFSEGDGKQAPESPQILSNTGVGGNNNSSFSFSTLPENGDPIFIVPPASTSDGVLSQVKSRDGETKFGELTENFLALESPLISISKTDLENIVDSQLEKESNTCFIIDASQDDFGAQANLGRGNLPGDNRNAWSEFLARFSNSTVNNLNSDILKKAFILGSIDLSDFKADSADSVSVSTQSQQQLCQIVDKVHDRATDIVSTIFSSHSQSNTSNLIYLNGDHNNMRSVLDGFHQGSGGKQKPIVIYLDLHGDSRPVEPGPHSGNWLTIAGENGHFEKAFLIGLNPLTNSQATLDNLIANNVLFEPFTWDKLLETNLESVAQKCVKIVKASYPNSPVILSICGDSVSHLPASAGNTVIGYDPSQVYSFINRISSSLNVRAFNVAEFKPSLGNSGASGEFLTQSVFLYLKSR